MIIDKPVTASVYPPPPLDGAAALPRSNGGAPALTRPDTREHSPAALDQAAKSANRQMEQIASQIRFNVSNEAGRTIVRMVDTQTKQILLQIPNEQMMKIAQDPAKLQGLILSQKA